MLKHVFAAAILFLSPVSGSASAFQCWPDPDTEYSKLLEADAVFLGEMTDFSFVSDESSDALYSDAVMAFDVIETLEGNLPAKVEINWDVPINSRGDCREPRTQR